MDGFGKDFGSIFGCIFNKKNVAGGERRIARKRRRGRVGFRVGDLQIHLKSIGKSIKKTHQFLIGFFNGFGVNVASFRRHFGVRFTCKHISKNIIKKSSDF